jgi:hypothetical protein
VRLVGAAEQREMRFRGFMTLVVGALQMQCNNAPAPSASSVGTPSMPDAVATLPSAAPASVSAAAVPGPPSAATAPSSAGKPAPQPRRACFPPFTASVAAPTANAALRLLANEPPDYDTGTQHYAERAVFRAPGAIPLTITAEHVPLFSRRYPLTKERHLFLGWTSWGSGEQSDHLWVVERTGGTLRVAARLKLSARRASTYFVLHRDGQNIRLGVPLDHDRAGVDEPWVTLDEKAISDRVNPPLPSPVPAGGDLECFCPPIGAEHTMRYVPDVPLVWFDIR